MKIDFVMGDLGAGFTGGDLLVYRLANLLVPAHAVRLIRLRNWRRYMERSGFEGTNNGQLYRTPFPSRVVEGLARSGLGRRILVASGVVPRTSVAVRIDRSVLERPVSAPEDAPSDGDHLIATSWPTAFFCAQVRTNARKHYLMQNFEDDPGYSGALAGLAGNSYALGLEKIAISARIRDRFGPTCQLVTPGVDTRVFRQDIPFERRPAHSIIMPLRAAPYKGSDMGIRVVESITDRIPDVSLTLFGNRHALRGIRPRPPKWVRTLHNPTNLELARAYNQSRIFLFPSRLEGFPVTPLEAMLCGCLVVSTPNSGVAPYLANGSTGFLSETFEIDSLASTLVSSFAQLDSSQAVVARGAATAGTYSWENSLRMFLQALT